MKLPARCASLVVPAVPSVSSGAQRCSSLLLHCSPPTDVPACRVSKTPAVSPTSRARTEVCTLLQTSTGNDLLRAAVDCRLQHVFTTNIPVKCLWLGVHAVKHCMTLLVACAGTWETQGPEPEIGIPALQKGSGVVVFQLKSSGSRKEGVHDVEVRLP